MKTIKLSEAKAHLGQYLRAAEEGEEFVISNRNRPIALLRGVQDVDRGVRPKLGLMDGRVRIPDDFDAPLGEFERNWYGE